MSSARTNRPPVSNMSHDKIVGIGLTIHERNIVAVLVIKLSLDRIYMPKHNFFAFLIPLPISCLAVDLFVNNPFLRMHQKFNMKK